MTAEWKKVWNKVPDEARVSEEVMHRNWLLAQAERLLQDYLASCEKYHFEPELSLDAVSGDAEKSEAAALVDRVLPEHVPLIQKAVAEDFTEIVARLPEYMREGLDDEIRQKFLVRQYFVIVRRVLDEASLPCKTFVFQPAIAVASLATDEARAHAASVIGNVQEEQVEKIEKAVEAAFKGFEASLDPLVIDNLSTDFREQWM